MNIKHHFKKVVGMMMMIIFLVGGLAALSAQAGVTEGNSGRGGQAVDVKKFVKPGYTTIIDFYSVHCPPCMAIAPKLSAMAAKRPKTNVVKLNIDRPGAKGMDFDSPLAKQYNLAGIPYFMVFDENGQLKAQGREAHMMVLEWCK